MNSLPEPGWLAFIGFCLLPLLAGGGFYYLLKRRGPARWRGLALGGVALVFFATAGFVLCETYYRFFYDQTDSFNYTLTSQRWFARHFKYNSGRFRDSVDYPDAIAPGSRRVTFLGDSFTAAHGVPDVEDRFANLIRRRHPAWDIQVIAGNGMDTGPELATLTSMNQLHYPLDVVVLVYCLNDISDLIPSWQAVMLRLERESQHRNWLLRNSYFADAYYYRLKARFDPEIPQYYPAVLEAHRGPLWATQKERLVKLRALVEAGGGRLVVVTFPFLHALGENYEYRFVHEQLGEFWRAQNVPHLDLLPVYAPYRTAQLVVNRLDAHPNEFAHGLAAEAIDKFLGEALKAP
jgi:lysophospholipase L1-like esterase